jgi:hypothetical protein
MRETSKALEAYKCYRDLGPCRSTAKVGQLFGKSKRLIDRWCSAHAWVKRVAAYEREQAEIAAREEAERRRRAREERLQVARGARAKGVEALMLVSPQELAHRPGDIVRLLEYADNGERKDLGEPDQKVELSGPEGETAVFTILIDRAEARGDEDDAGEDDEGHDRYVD